MITIEFIDSEKELTKNDIEQLGLLWGTPLQNVEAFFNSQDPHDFYSLFYESLLVDRAINIDWRWAPEDIVGQITYLLPKHGIELVSSNEIKAQDGEITYKIEFKLDNHHYKLEVPFEEPGAMFDFLNKLIHPHQFIALDTKSDEYCWLLISDSFDISELCKIAGLRRSSTEKQSKAVAENANIKLEGKQSVKLFFKPTIYLYKNGQRYVVKYKYPNVAGYGTWAGRILPGQTIHEGVAAELRKELNYFGPFEIENVTFHDYGADRKKQESRTLFH